MGRFAKKFVGFVILVCLCAQAQAQVCNQWSTPEKVGNLDSNIVEASGMAVSSQYTGRTYYINDSGSAGEFFATDMAGKLEQRVRIADFNPLDTEDMTYGPCGNDKCIYIGDIGDNYHLRFQSSMVAIKEVQNFHGYAEPIAKFTFRYDDRVSHDVEALGMQPNGDLIAVTKDYNKNTKMVEVAKVFKLSSEELWRNKDRQQTMHYIGSLDIAGILNKRTGEDSLVTSMSIHATGKRFTLLTYSHAIEFYFDISQGIKNEILAGDYSVINLERLRQQESIAYLPDLDGLLYSTEDRSAPVYKVICTSRKDDNK